MDDRRNADPQASILPPRSPGDDQSAALPLASREERCQGATPEGPGDAREEYARRAMAFADRQPPYHIWVALPVADRLALMEWFHPSRK